MLVPKLRFPKFSDADEWENTPLGNTIEDFRKKSSFQDEFEVLTSARSGLIRQREYYDNDSITERDNIGFNIIPPSYLTYRSRSDDRRFYFNENNLGITGIISTYYPVFRVLKGSNKFFIELLSRNSQYVGKRSVGTSQTVLSLNELRRITLPIPNQAEQQKIADCLCSIDELISAQGQKVEALNTYKKGLMQQLFPTNGETIPRLRFPEFRDAEEWEETPLNQLAKRCKQKNSLYELNRVLTNSAEFGVLDQRDFFDKDIANKSNLDGYYIVKKGDYVYNPRISKTAPVGPISKNNVGDGVMSPLYTVFRFNNYDNSFYAHYFSSTRWHHYMRQASSTGARHDRMAITNDDFMALPLPITSPEEQQKIADCLSSIDELISAHSQKLDTLKTHKQGLMQQLFPAMDDANAEVGA